MHLSALCNVSTLRLVQRFTIFLYSRGRGKGLQPSTSLCNWADHTFIAYSCVNPAVMLTKLLMRVFTGAEARASLGLQPSTSLLNWATYTLIPYSCVNPAVMLTQMLVQVFTEAEVRASLVFQLSKLCSFMLKASRLATGAAPWDALVAGGLPYSCMSQ